ncbi:hypothetical protein VTK56DRAFT_6309 [Thermocarpiscus australiensis]
MSTTVGALLDIFYDRPTADADARPSLSRKSWTDQYHLLDRRHVDIHPPTKEAIDSFLGPGLSYGDNYAYQLPSEVDYIGLQNPVHPLNVAHQMIQSEGDGDRDFYQNFEPPFRLAFSGWPFLWPRSLLGPTGPTDTSVTVDYQLTWPGENRLLERATMVGELKQPYVIIPEEWSEKPPGDITRRLQRQMRGYAHRYKCPQVFVFDSVHLLILQFRAASRDEIKSQECDVDCCIIPREELFPGLQCTIQYALYRLAWRGWMRLSATLAGQNSARKPLDVAVDGIPRVYEWWSGRPAWRVAGRYQFGHPNGWKRQFIRDGTDGYFIWVDDNGNYPNGVLVCDTGNCLLNLR